MSDALAAARARAVEAAQLAAQLAPPPVPLPPVPLPPVPLPPAPPAAAPENGGIGNFMKSVFDGSYFMLPPPAAAPAARPAPARAEGGPVTAKSPYLVGEKGPELFIPSAAGNILSNPKMKSVMDGINSSLDALGSNVNKTSSTDTTIGNINAGIVKKFEQLSKITALDVDRAGNYSVRYKQLVDNNTTLQDDTLKDAKRIEKATKIDANLADKYSLAFKSYMEIKTQLMEIETPMLQKQMGELANGNIAGGVGGGAGGGAGGGFTDKIKSFFGGGSQSKSAPLGSGDINVGGGDSKPKLGTISSKSGKSASVAADTVPAFQKLIDYLDSVGYDIQSLGGYVDRDVRGQPGVKSAHAKGSAIDINPAANPMGSTLVTDMPEGIRQVASSLGLGWGGDWNSIKDAMHFSAAKNEGGRITAKEGIQVDGPETGYPATLHGKEAVIPMQNGSGDFVKMFKDMAESTGNLVDGVSGYTSAIDKVVQTISLNNADYNEGGKFATATSGAGEGGMGLTAFGANEWTGINQGPLTTDLKVLKDIAAELGAFDKATQIITDPATWKQILNSGVGTTYNLGAAKIGTTSMEAAGIPGAKASIPGEEIARMVKELKESSGVDTATALKDVVAELQATMAEAFKRITAGGITAKGDAADQQFADQMVTMANFMGQMTRLQQTSNDIQQKILSNAM